MSRPTGSKNKLKDTTPVAVLDPRERAGIVTELEQKEKMLNAGKEFGHDDYVPTMPEGVDIDTTKLKSRVTELKAVLDKSDSLRVTDQTERRKIEARMKQLEDQFMPYLETWRDIGAMNTSTPEYREAYNKALARPKVEHLFREWKTLAKRLEPDDSYFSSLDRLRKDK